MCRTQPRIGQDKVCEPYQGLSHDHQHLVSLRRDIRDSVANKNTLQIQNRSSGSFRDLVLIIDVAGE